MSSRPRPMGMLFVSFAKADGSGAAAPGGVQMVGRHNAILTGLAKKHGGVVVKSDEAFCGVVFEGAAQAALCALAAVARFAEHNRSVEAAKRVSLRQALHFGDVVLKQDEIAGEGTPVLERLLEATPPGRVFSSREVYTQALGRSPCAFIPLGLEYFKGLPEPLLVYEVVPVPGLDTQAPMPKLRATELAARDQSAALPGPAQPPRRGAFESLAASPAGLAAVLAAAGLMLALERPLLTILSPLDLANYVFHSAGHVLFGLAGGEDAARLGAVALQLGLPAAALGHCLLNWRGGTEAALFWLGQSLLSLGARLSLPGVDLQTFAGCEKADGLILARSAGLLKHYYAAGQTEAFAGCLLIALAVYGAVSRYRERPGGA